MPPSGETSRGEAAADAEEEGAAAAATAVDEATTDEAEADGVEDAEAEAGLSTGAPTAATLSELVSGRRMVGPDGPTDADPAMNDWGLVVEAA